MKIKSAKQLCNLIADRKELNITIPGYLYDDSPFNITMEDAIAFLAKSKNIANLERRACLLMSCTLTNLGIEIVVNSQYGAFVQAVISATVQLMKKQLDIKKPL